MGWKNVKEHYGIKHIIRIEDGILSIGSGYLPRLISIAETGRTFDREPGVHYQSRDIGHNLTIWRPEFLGKGEPFDGFVERMAADPATLRRLIDTPDTFERSITVYTYDMGEIIEKQCEELGWPNVTLDGCVMYENLFSADRDQVVRWALLNARAACELVAETVKQCEADLANRRYLLAQYEAAVARLQIEPAAATVDQEDETHDD